MKTLSALLDFQRFSGNKALEALIAETEGRVAKLPNQLSDDDLEWVAAAGEGHIQKKREQKNEP